MSHMEEWDVKRVDFNDEIQHFWLRANPLEFPMKNQIMSGRKIYEVGFAKKNLRRVFGQEKQCFLRESHMSWTNGFNTLFMCVIFLPSNAESFEIPLRPLLVINFFSQFPSASRFTIQVQNIFSWSTFSPKLILDRDYKIASLPGAWN